MGSGKPPVLSTGRIGAFLCSSSCVSIRKLLDKLYRNRKGIGFGGEGPSGMKNEVNILVFFGTDKLC